MFIIILYIFPFLAMDEKLETLKIISSLETEGLVQDTVQHTVYIMEERSIICLFKMTEDAPLVGSRHS